MPSGSAPPVDAAERVVRAEYPRILALSLIHISEPTRPY